MTSWLVPWCLAWMALAAGGCKPDYPLCKKDKHCKVDLGEKCVEGTCQNCVTNTDCLAKGPSGEDWVCHEFRCQDPALVGGAGPGGLGAPCPDGQCEVGLVCIEGICSACIDDLQCAPGTCDVSTGRCVGGGGTVCTSDDTCGMDEICENGYCVYGGVPSGTNPCNLDAIYFDFDSPVIKPEEGAQLRSVAECMRAALEKGNKVYLEAHADPRGTEEYNIMLTDRRGQSVQRFLEDLGVPGGRMQVISKGDLEARGTDESTWAKDRRVQFIYANE